MGRQVSPVNTALLRHSHSASRKFLLWSGRCFPRIMNNVGHVSISETTRTVGPKKARRGRPRKNVARESDVRDLPAVGTLTRTKSLLLAALRVWELKHRITD
jgi:hypothetical protein